MLGWLFVLGRVGFCRLTPKRPLALSEDFGFSEFSGQSVDGVEQGRLFFLDAVFMALCSKNALSRSEQKRTKPILLRAISLPNTKNE